MGNLPIVLPRICREQPVLRRIAHLFKSSCHRLAKSLFVAEFVGNGMVGNEDTWRGQVKSKDWPYVDVQDKSSVCREIIFIDTYHGYVQDGLRIPAALIHQCPGYCRSGNVLQEKELASLW